MRHSIGAAHDPSVGEDADTSPFAESAKGRKVSLYRYNRCSTVIGRSVRLISTIAHGEVGGP
jgi:hypothetical protein